MSTESNAPKPAPDSAPEVLEWHAPVLVKTEEHESVPAMFRERVKRGPREPMIARKAQMGSTWREMPAQDFLDEVNLVARGLIGLGLQPGDAISIMSHTRYEWTLVDFAAWSAGLVVVPIYETSSVDQIKYILEDADVKMVVTETMVMAQLVQAARVTLERSVQVLSLDNSAIMRITEAGAEVDEAEVDACIAGLNIHKPASIVYTSGTTGKPKGTVLTHGNFVTLCKNGHKWMPEIAYRRSSRLLLFLPLAHVYARMLEVFQITGHGIMAHTPNTRNLLSDLESFRPTYLLAVPRVLEKIYNSADAAAGSGVALKTFRWAVKTAIQYSKALDTTLGPSRTLSAQHQMADAMVYRKIRALLGGNCKYIISGGGPLGERLGHFFRGAGITVLEGYGLTETLGPMSVNTPTVSKIGTVGPPVATVGVRISDTGEILIKGPTVFSHYHNMPEETAAAFDEDGWFHTGDIGSLDRDGYVTISGRQKEIIVTAGGKNVVPTVLEDKLRGHPLISQVVVVGDLRPFVAALVTLDAEMLPGWLKNHNLPAMTVSEAMNHPEILAALNRAVERANKAVSRAESIRKIKVLSTDFTEANGMLTPSMKVKRPVVLETFKDEIDEIYGGPVHEAGE